MTENLTPEQVVEKINEKFNATLATMPTKSDLDGLKSDVEALKTLEAKSQEIEKAIARFEGNMEAMDSSLNAHHVHLVRQSLKRMFLTSKKSKKRLKKAE